MFPGLMGGSKKAKESETIKETVKKEVNKIVDKISKKKK